LENTTVAIPAITVHLSDEQYERIAPFREQIGELAEKGNPGMLLAQIFGRTIKVFVADGAQAEAMQAAMGCPVGVTTDTLSSS
jgi:hypothetical protein